MNRTQENKQLDLSKYIWIVPFIASVALLLANAWRASTFTFTHDECFSFNEYVHRTFMGIISYELPVIPNNHILNTLFMKLENSIFGNSELSLRLHLLIALVFYLYFSWKICAFTASRLLQLAGFICLAFQPYVLDYFVLARGYGLGMMMMMGSIYFLLRFQRFALTLDICLAIFLSFLAVVSNFIFLPYFVISLGLWLLMFFSDKKFKIRKLNWIGPLLILTFSIIFLFEPLRKMKGQTFGGESGFFTDTLLSLLHRTFYALPDPVYITIGVCISVIVAFAGLKLVMRIVKMKMIIIDHPLWMMTIITIGTFLVTEIQFYLLGHYFLANRTGIYFIPLFILVLVFLLSPLENGKTPIAVSMFGIFFLAMIMMFTTLVNFGWHHPRDCFVEPDVRPALERILTQSQNAGRDSIHVGGTWIFRPVVNYYRQTKKREKLSVYQDREKIENPNSDYLLISMEDQWKPNSDAYELDTLYESSKLSVYRKK